MKVLRPHDRFHIILPVHTKTMKTTENAFNLLLRMCKRRSQSERVVCQTLNLVPRAEHAQ